MARHPINPKRRSNALNTKVAQVGASPSSGVNWWPEIVVLLIGLWLGITLVKIGNPVVLDRLVESPETLGGIPPVLGGNPASMEPSVPDRLTAPWPLRYGFYGLIAIIVPAAIVGSYRRKTPWWILGLLIIWFVWQLLAATRSISPTITQLTLLHFMVCIVCFFLGSQVVGPSRRPHLVWVGLTIGYLVVLWVGLGQHYGGLEAVKKAVYETPNWEQLPSEFLKRVMGGRIFSTLVYPNALAGAVLLYAPPATAFLWLSTARFTPVVRGVLTGLLVYLSIACLVWSGSKAGWIIGLVMLIIILVQSPLAKQVKWWIVAGLVVFGMTGFALRYQNYFQKGATSVSARFDYWKAAVSITFNNPVFGTGPGSFQSAYSKVKRPDAEMARLAHNDFLEQASDSGIVGFLAYCCFIWGSIGLLYRNSARNSDPMLKAMLLGIAGWALQSLVEFGLYIPALAWPSFTIIGTMFARYSVDDNDIAKNST